MAPGAAISNCAERSREPCDAGTSARRCCLPVAMAISDVRSTPDRRAGSSWLQPRSLRRRLRWMRSAWTTGSSISRGTGHPNCRPKRQTWHGMASQTSAASRRARGRRDGDGRAHGRPWVVRRSQRARPGSVVGRRGMDGSDSAELGSGSASSSADAWARRVGAKHAGLRVADVRRPIAVLQPVPSVKHRRRRARCHRASSCQRVPSRGPSGTGVGTCCLGHRVRVPRAGHGVLAHVTPARVSQTRRWRWTSPCLPAR